MATFTMTVADIMGNDYNASPKLLGLDRYPIFSEGHRPILNEKIILRYWTQEIGFETDSLFRHHMHARMNEIMGYYNQMYKTTLVEFDMFETVDILSQGKDVSRGTVSGESDAEATSGSKSDSKSRTVQSETPQTRLSPNEDYATAATDAVSESTADSDSMSTERSTSEQDQSGESENRTRGSQGAKSALLLQFRETILNIDSMVVDDLSDLFMQVWSNGDDFTGSRPLWGLSPAYPYGFGYF